MRHDPTETGKTELSFQEYAKHVSDVIWIDGIPWNLYGRVLMPLCMPHVPINVDRSELRRAMSRTHALLGCWTTHWDAFDNSEWWWTVCDQENYELDSIRSSRGRRSVRKGLRDCNVHRIEGARFPYLTYPIYKEQVERYGMPSPTLHQYVKHTAQLAEYPGTEFWGAFYSGDLAAYAVCLIVDEAVSLGSMKSDIRLHRHQPNAALFYTLSKHYLDSGLKYITNGSQTLWHPTTVNEFLETIGFHKRFCKVNVEISCTARVIILRNWQVGVHILDSEKN